MAASLLASWAAASCGPADGDPPGETEQGSGTTTAAGESSSSGATLDGTGSEGSSDTTGPVLPCAWIEGTYEADVPVEMTPSDVQCDPETGTATLRIAAEELTCNDAPSGDRLTIELPPELQAAGEYDLTQLVASIRMAADLDPVAGQVDAGTLIITAVTPTAVIGWAHGGLQGYDFSGSFEAPYCP